MTRTPNHKAASTLCSTPCGMDRELDRFLEATRAHWDQHVALILVLFTTGLRLGTALALRRSDLDEESGEFIVTRRLSDGSRHRV
jgi:integrase